MWKEMYEKKWVKWTVRFCALVIGVLWLSAPKENYSKSLSPKSNYAGSTKDQSYTVYNYKDKTIKNVFDELKNGYDVKSLDIKDHNGKKVFVSEIKAKENLTLNLTRKACLLYSKELFKKMNDVPEFGGGTIIWKGDSQDVYGNQGTMDLMEIKIDYPTFEKINWENILLKNLPTIADEFTQCKEFTEAEIND